MTNPRMLAALEAIAAQHGVTPQAMAWALDAAPPNWSRLIQAPSTSTMTKARMLAALESIAAQQGMTLEQLVAWALDEAE